MLLSSYELSVRTNKKELELAGTSIVMADVCDYGIATVQLW